MRRNEFLTAKYNKVLQLIRQALEGVYYSLACWASSCFDLYNQLQDFSCSAAMNFSNSPFFYVKNFVFFLSFLFFLFLDTLYISIFFTTYKPNFTYFFYHQKWSLESFSRGVRIIMTPPPMQTATFLNPSKMG